MIGHHGLWHKGNAAWLADGKKGYRPNMFDDATRVPLLFRWPGVITPGTVISHVVSNLDLFPTLLELTGLGGPLISSSVDGASFLFCAVRRPRGTTLFSASTTCTTTR